MYSHDNFYLTEFLKAGWFSKYNVLYTHLERQKALEKSLLTISENADMQHLQIICIIKLALLSYSSQTQLEFVFLSLSRKGIWEKMIIYISLHLNIKLWNNGSNIMQWSFLFKTSFVLAISCFVPSLQSMYNFTKIRRARVTIQQCC